MKSYKLEIELKVSEKWIADGFDPTSKVWKEKIEDNLLELLPYAYGLEFIVDVKNVIAPKFTIKELEELRMI